MEAEISSRGTEKTMHSSQNTSNSNNDAFLVSASNGRFIPNRRFSHTEGMDLR